MSRYRADWNGTNHFEITDSIGKDYWIWTLDGLLHEINGKFIDSSQPMARMLGEMMDAWVEKKNRENDALLQKKQFIHG